MIHVAILSGKHEWQAVTMLFAKVCSSTMVECDARKVSNYFQELEQGAINLSFQENEHRHTNNGWFMHYNNLLNCRSIELHTHVYCCLHITHYVQHEVLLDFKLPTFGFPILSLYPSKVCGNLRKQYNDSFRVSDCTIYQQCSSSNRSPFSLHIQVIFATQNGRHNYVTTPNF